MTCSGIAAGVSVMLIGVAVAGGSAGPPESQSNAVLSLAPAAMTPVGTVDERYQSYNVEMLEVTGGRFWRPYGPEFDAALKAGTPTATAPAKGGTPAGMDARLYEYRPPIDLTSARLRKLASALGPSYVRVSGTWANSTYVPELRGAPGGVALLAINTDTTHPRTLTIPSAGARYTLSSASGTLQETRVQLNGVELALGAGDALPPLTGAATVAGTLPLAPATITFLALAQAGNTACR